jgi:hypothetical protein
MREINYTAKGFTNSNNEYVTVDADDMSYLMNQVIRTMAGYAELTASSEGGVLVCQRNKEMFGKRGKTSIAPGRSNTRLSVLGGVVNNYFTKQESFKNDISSSQLPYITQVLNECCEEFGFEPIVFKNQLFKWD